MYARRHYAKKSQALKEQIFSIYLGNANTKAVATYVLDEYFRQQVYYVIPRSRAHT